jgi:RNA polymerase sigma-70 factor (ECF subfamily)
MSRADAYAAFYRESRGRLLHQVYAYCGDGEVAQRALADAFVSAGHHWRKIADDPNKDAWVRERAFRATRRSLNRARKPWYVRALHTAEEHRPILQALQVLRPTDRKLLILVSLVGLDLPQAAREAGVTDVAAEHSLAQSALVMSEFGGLDPTPEGIRAGLNSLRGDLVDEPVDRASRLRREGNRRRRSHMGLAALCSVALVIGAGALTAQQPERVSAEGPESPQKPKPEPTDPSKLPKPVEGISASSLAPVSAVAKMKYANPWRLTDTSTDFGTTAPYDECLQAVPQDKRAAHFYVRTFQSGRGQHPSIATESMEVSANIQAADRTYLNLVKDFSACTADNHQIKAYSLVRGVGDAASVIQLKYVDERGVHDQLIGISQTGLVTLTWVIDTPNARAASPLELVRLMATSVQSVCSQSMGGCSRRPFQMIAQVPPKIDRAKGFLTALDLPVFEGLTEPWVATSPSAVKTNPASTGCDQADFVAAKAKEIEARSFVVPSDKTLATIFGMTETRGRFDTMEDATAFLQKVANNVRRCHDRQLSLDVKSGATFPVEQGYGRSWTITLAASKSRDLTFRMGMFRVGTTVGQVTFTPTPRYDLTPEEYNDVVRRAALRATQN